MASKITASVIVNSATASDPFTASGDFEIIVKSGRVQLETLVDGEYYVVSEVFQKNSTVVALTQRTSTKVTSIENGRTYKLVPVTAKATAEAWQL